MLSRLHKVRIHELRLMVAMYSVKLHMQRIKARKTEIRMPHAQVAKDDPMDPPQHDDVDQPHLSKDCLFE